MISVKSCSLSGSTCTCMKIRPRINTSPWHIWPSALWQINDLNCAITIKLERKLNKTSTVQPVRGIGYVWANTWMGLLISKCTFCRGKLDTTSSYMSLWMFVPPQLPGNYLAQVIYAKNLSHHLLLHFSNWYGFLWPGYKISGCVSLASRKNFFDKGSPLNSFKFSLNIQRGDTYKKSAF